MSAEVKFARGSINDLPDERADGCFYLTTDEVQLHYEDSIIGESLSRLSVHPQGNVGGTPNVIMSKGSIAAGNDLTVVGSNAFASGESCVAGVLGWRILSKPTLDTDTSTFVVELEDVDPAKFNFADDERDYTYCVYMEGWYECLGSLTGISEKPGSNGGTLVYISDNGQGWPADKSITTGSFLYTPYEPLIGSLAKDAGQHAEGRYTKALVYSAHAEGNYSVAASRWSHAEGNGTFAVFAAHSEGDSTKALGHSAHSEGHSTVAKGYHSHAEGEQTESVGYASHAEGRGSKALAMYSHAEGWDTEASGEQGAHAEGKQTVAGGFSSHAEGEGCKATGDDSHAEGRSSSATGDVSHAEGKECVAQGGCSHAQGASSKSYGYCSFAGGLGSTATGECSFAFGHVSHARNAESVAIGYRAETHPDYTRQIVLGTWNAITAGKLLVGVGTSDSKRMTGLRVDDNGNLFVKGGICINSGDDCTQISTSVVPGRAIDQDFVVVGTTSSVDNNPLDWAYTIGVKDIKVPNTAGNAFESLVDRISTISGVASEAQNTAFLASGSAQAASSTATEALSAATDANSTAQGAAREATEAYNIASAASGNADAALSQAGEAYGTASSAAQNAETAVNMLSDNIIYDDYLEDYAVSSILMEPAHADNAEPPFKGKIKIVYDPSATFAVDDNTLYLYLEDEA